MNLKRSEVKKKLLSLKEKLQPYLKFIFKDRTQIKLLLEKEGLTRTEDYIKEHYKSPNKRAYYLGYLSRLIYPTDFSNFRRLGLESLSIQPKIFWKKWFAFKLFDHGEIEVPHTLTATLPFYRKLNAITRNKIRFIAGIHQLNTLGISVPSANLKAYEPIGNRILYVAASALPYHNTGYTIRTQNLLQGLAAVGWEVLCVTRPGYPEDRPDKTNSEKDHTYQIDHVHYETLHGPHRQRLAPKDYVFKAADILEAKMRAFRPSIVQAASNHENALPALIAAKRLGIPFFYEVRGLWELTRSSKMVNFENSERFKLEQHLENTVSRYADRIITLGTHLAQELIERGASAEKIKLAPNAIDPAAFTPLPKDEALMQKLKLTSENFIIGYAGAILAYEGLDDLITGFSLLLQQVPRARLVIIGDGDALESLKQKAHRLQLQNEIHFIGKIAHHEIKQYYSIFNVIVLPRKPYKVCQLVTPLKPLEAMALKIPLVVSDVAALQEIVQHGETGLVHRAGDPISLASTLHLLTQDESLCEKLSNTAYHYVTHQRTWIKICEELTPLYLEFILNNKPQAIIHNNYECLAYNEDISADEILLHGWRYRQFPPIKLDEIPWALKSDEQRSWNFSIHCWDMIEPLLKRYSDNREDLYLRMAAQVMIEWINLKNTNAYPDLSPFIWYDMAVGIRAARLSYVIVTNDIKNIFDIETRELLMKSLDEHRAYLAQDKNIAFHNNHGLFQVFGQLTMARCFAAKSPLMALSLIQAQNRLKTILAQQFTKEAVHTEHSPQYHYMVYHLLNLMITTNLIQDQKALKLVHRIEESLSWFILPNGHICNFGDSDAISLSINRIKPIDDFICYPESGYFVVRTPSDEKPNDSTQDSYLAQIAAFHSRTHKHADDLSFIWSEHGTDILVDSGRFGYMGKTQANTPLWDQGFWYSDSNRIYCESTRAHNTVLFDTLDYLRKGIKPYGSAIKRWIKTPERIFAIETRVMHFNQIEHERLLVFYPGKWLLVFDKFNDMLKNKHNVQQWFHLAPHLSITKYENGFTIPIKATHKPLQVINLMPANASRIYCGEREPTMQGFVSLTEGEITPAPAFCYELKDCANGYFSTLFSFSDFLNSNIHENKVYSKGHKIKMHWKDETKTHRLLIDRKPKDLKIDYKINRVNHD